MTVVNGSTLLSRTITTAGILCTLCLAGCEGLRPRPAPLPTPPPPAAPEPTQRLTRAEETAVYNRALEQLLLAARSDLDIVSCNAIEALIEVAPRDGRPIFREAAAARSPIVRFAAFLAIGELRDAESMPRIRAGLSDPHPHVRLGAAFAAYRCGKSGGAKLLTQTLVDAPAEGLRAEAASLVGRLGESRAVRWLRAAQQDDVNRRSSRIQLAIYGSLARLGDEDALRQLVLYSRGTTAERVESLLILAELDHREIRDDLIYALVGPEHEYLEARLVAARGLGKLGFPDGYDLAARMLTYTDPNRRPSAKDPDRTFAVRSLAAHALAEIGDRRPLAQLRDIAADPTDARLQVAASYAICKILKNR